MANSNDSQPPPFSSGGFQLTPPRAALEQKTIIKADDLDDSYVNALIHGQHTQYVKITKWAIQKFLEACLTEGGQFRGFFDRFAPFTGDFVVNENFDGDPRKRHLQIARFFDGVVERPPQLFIQDAGYNYTPSGLGTLVGGWNKRDKYGNQVNHVFDSVTCPIDITFASTSVDDADDMQGFLSMAFGWAQRYLMNYYLMPDKRVRGAYWVVLLPLRNDVTPKTRQALHGDPTDQIWLVSMNLQCIFENSTFVQYRAAPQGDLQPGVLRVSIPQKITLADTIPITIQDMPYPIDVFSDNYKIAIVEEQKSQFILHPKRLGKCNIVVRKRGGGDQDIILAKKEVKIALR